MKFLADQDVYASTIAVLRGAGHDVAPVAQLGLARADDAELGGTGCGGRGLVHNPRLEKANLRAVSLVSDDDDLERLMLGRSPRFQAMLKRSEQSLNEGKGLSSKEFWAAVIKWAKERKAAAAKGGSAKGKS